MKVEFKIGKDSEVFKIKNRGDATKVCYVIQGELLKSEIAPSITKKIKYKLDNKPISGVELLRGLKTMLKRDEFKSDTKSEKSAKSNKKFKEKKSSKKKNRAEESSKKKSKKKGKKEDKPKKKEKISLNFGTDKTEETENNHGLTKVHRIKK